MSSSPQPVFSGSIAAIYQQYMVPMLFAPYARVLAQRFSETSGHVLETAAGTGIVTRELATISKLKIIATDLSAAMLEVARAEVPASNVEWRAADAGALPFASETFDAVVCQFGAMFFPDKPKAFGEARRVLRADGRFVLVVWDCIEENGITYAVSEAVREMFPDDPPEFFPKIPHGYSDRTQIEGDLRGGGFREFAIETLALRSPAASAADAALALCGGTPLRNELEARAPGRLATVIDDVTATLRRQFGEGAIDAKMQALVVEAQR
jgi:SAM-dependent methyltransferase